MITPDLLQQALADVVSEIRGLSSEERREQLRLSEDSDFAQTINLLMSMKKDEISMLDCHFTFDFNLSQENMEIDSSYIELISYFSELISSNDDTYNYSLAA